MTEWSGCLRLPDFAAVSSLSSYESSLKKSPTTPENRIKKRQPESQLFAFILLLNRASSLYNYRMIVNCFPVGFWNYEIYEHVQQNKNRQNNIFSGIGTAEISQIRESEEFPETLLLLLNNRIVFVCRQHSPGWVKHDMLHGSAWNLLWIFRPYRLFTGFIHFHWHWKIYFFCKMYFSGCFKPNFSLF